MYIAVRLLRNRMFPILVCPDKSVPRGDTVVEQAAGVDCNSDVLHVFEPILREGNLLSNVITLLFHKPFPDRERLLVLPVFWTDKEIAGTVDRLGLGMRRFIKIEYVQ